MDELNIKIRHLELEDYEDLRKAMELSYANIDDDPWRRRDIARLLKVFPEGQIAIEVNGRVVGCALSIIVNYDQFGDNHTYNQNHGQRLLLDSLQ